METPGIDAHRYAGTIGWLLSCILHSSLLLGALFFVQKVQLAPQPEPFKWNVAMVSPEPVVHPAAPAPLPPATTPKPATAAPVQAPVHPQQDRPSEPSPVKPTIAPPSPVQLKTPVMPSAAPPAPPVTVPSPSPVQHTKAPEPVPSPIVKPTESQTVAPHRPEPLPQAPVQEHKPEPVPLQPAQTQPVEQRIEQTSLVSVPQPIVEPPPAPATPPAAPHREAEPPVAAQSVPPPVQAEQPAPPPAAGPSQPHNEPQVASIAPARPSTPTRVDYGWLSDTILRRVEELKRYPAEARGDRAEGKVIVKAVIKEDGTVGNVEVVRSSGFQSLDQAALELMRHAGPFNLPHALGKPQVTIQIPLNYRLDRP